MKNKIKLMMKGGGYKNGLGNMKGCYWYKERERGKIKKERQSDRLRERERQRK